MDFFPRALAPAEEALGKQREALTSLRSLVSAQRHRLLPQLQAKLPQVRIGLPRLSVDGDGRIGLLDRAEAGKLGETATAMNAALTLADEAAPAACNALLLSIVAALLSVGVAYLTYLVSASPVVATLSAAAVNLLPVALAWRARVRYWFGRALSLVNDSRSAASEALDVIDQQLLTPIESARSVLDDVATQVLEPVKSAVGGLRSSLALVADAEKTFPTPSAEVEKAIDAARAALDDATAQATAEIDALAKQHTPQLKQLARLEAAISLVDPAFELPDVSDLLAVVTSKLTAPVDAALDQAEVRARRSHVDCTLNAQ